MKKTFRIISVAALLLALLPAAKAQTTLTAWNFDNVSAGASASPAPSTGFGTAGAIGLGANSNPDVQSLPGSSAGLANSWRVRGTGGGIGWSTSAPLGSQGARFTASTLGYYKVKLTFDVFATSDAEAALQVQYTTEGTIWNNAPITSAGTLGYIASNASPTNSLVVGSYVVLTNNGTAGWNNGVTVDLTGISGVDNNSAFAIRIVNAATGTNCFAVNGTLYNNTSGDWTFDNVVIQGKAIDTIADWTFESYGTSGTNVYHPVPEFSVGNTALATSIGFDWPTTFVFADGSHGSTNAPDTLVQSGSSTPSGTICWRVRGQGPGNGWTSQSGIGTQGAEFDVNTTDYNDVVLTFDLYFTTQGEAKMCVQYTTDGTTWNTANNLFYPANPTFILTNPPALSGGSSDTVTGTYFYQTKGQNWYNNLVVDFTGVPNVANNPNFGIRIVNAARNGDCVNFTGGSYNNSSGNCRFDNVSVGGTFNGSTPPVLAYAPNATVDAPFTITFSPDDPTWRQKITAVYVNGSVLTNSAFATNVAGQITFTPSQGVPLQTAGTLNIVFYAAGYSSAKVTQPIVAGAPATFSIIQQPAAPSASGGTLTVNPILGLTDIYGNGTTNGYPNITVTAKPSTSKWILGGDTNQICVGGFINFTNLTATSTNLSGQTANSITFTISGYAPLTTTNSAQFNIGAAPVAFTPGNLAVLQIDTLANNTTFSMVEVKPSAAGQTKPVNVVPISATGPNALRLANAGSTGRLALSDDGTLIAFVGFSDGSSATPDETFTLNRAVGTLNYTNQFSIGSTYTSISLGGSEGRACCTLDNFNWIVDDKGGLYYGNSSFSPLVNFSIQNNVVCRTFGGIPYIETQKTAGGSPIPVVYALDPVTRATQPNNLGTDPIASDFYLISTNGGLSYDVMYIIDQASSSQGIIKKYSWVAGADMSNPNGNYGWATSGTFTNGTGVDGLFATTNGGGGVYLYYTTQANASKSLGNMVIRLTDAAGWNQNLSVTSSNLIYSAPTNTYVKGLTFVPRKDASTAWLVPPPILTAQTVATVASASITVTNTPDDAQWRNSITGITVNGTVLPASAYATNQAGKLVFFPAQSALLQTPGTKTIVISAAGYSTNSVAQTLATGPATQLVVTAQPVGPAADGAVLATQPVVKAEDVYGNVVTNNISVTSAAVQNTWTLGGTKIVTTSAGVATFAGLTAFSANGVVGATISFTAGALSATSQPFNISAPVPVNLNGVALTGGKFKFTFSNPTGLSFSVLATNNLTAPIATWPVVGQAVEGPAGTYQYTNSAAVGAQQYYIIRQP